MIELTGYSNLLMNSLLVNNLLVSPVAYEPYSSYNDMLPDMLTTDISDYYGEDYSLDISAEAYKLTLLEGLSD